MKSIKTCIVIMASLLSLTVHATTKAPLAKKRINAVERYVKAIRNRDSLALESLFTKNARMFISGKENNAILYVAKQFKLNPVKARVKIVNFYIGEPIKASIILYAKYEPYDQIKHHFTGKETAFFDLFVFQPKSATIENVYVLGDKLSSNMLESVALHTR